MGLIHPMHCCICTLTLTLTVTSSSQVKSSDSIKSTQLDSRDTIETQRWNALWSQIHLSLLQSMLSSSSSSASSSSLLGTQSQQSVVTLDDVQHIVHSVCNMIDQSRDGTSDKQSTVAVDRLVQFLQVAMSTAVFSCSNADFQALCQAIPKCRLLQIVQSQRMSQSSLSSGYKMSWDKMRHSSKISHETRWDIVIRYLMRHSNKISHKTVRHNSL